MTWQEGGDEASGTGGLDPAPFESLRAGMDHVDEVVAMLDARERQLEELRAALEERKAILDEFKASLDGRKAALDERQAALDGEFASALAEVKAMQALLQARLRELGVDRPPVGPAA